MRVVFDTNTLLAALITKHNPPSLLYTMWRDEHRFDLVTSEWQLSEFRRVSRYERLKPYLKPYEAGALVQRLRRSAVVLTELPRVDLSPDPDDNLLIATALAGDVDYLISGDKRHVLSLGTVEGIKIVTARKLLELLE